MPVNRMPSNGITIKAQFPESVCRCEVSHSDTKAIMRFSRNAPVPARIPITVPRIKTNAFSGMCLRLHPLVVLPKECSLCCK